METFYCVGCRFAYPLEKAGHLTPAAHRDGAPVGFCFLCARELLGEGAVEDQPEVETVVSQPAAEPAATA
jgi:hypothetical protein